MSVVGGPRLSTIFQNQYSFQFDGTNEYITIPNNTNLSFGNSITDSAFSVSCWVYCVDSTRFRTLSKSTEWLHGPFGDDRLGLILIDSNTSNYIARTSNITIPQNVWVSIISTYDGSGLNTGIKHYINGVEPASYNNLAAGSYTAMHGSTSNFYIGRDSDFGNYYANGNIDEVVVFNYELSAADAITIYNNGAPADISSLSPISWWRMGDGDTYYDMVNGLFNSENLSGWPRVGINITGTPPYANVEVAPDGQTTADKIIEDTSTGAHYIRHTANIVTGVEYNVSCYLKAAERTKVRIRTNIDGNGASTCDLDLTTGGVSNSTFPNNIVMTDEGNGWWRFSTYTTSAYTAGNSVIYVFLYDALDQTSYTGDGTSGVYLWGLQLSTSQEVLPYFQTTNIIRYIGEYLMLDHGNENNFGVTTNMEEADRVTDVP